MAAAATALGWAGARFRQTSGPGTSHERAQRLCERRRRTAPMPAEITEHAKYHLLDTLGIDDLGIGIAARPGGQRYLRERGAKGYCDR